jgi:hypothetical protein
MVKMNAVPVSGKMWVGRVEATRGRATGPNPFERLVEIMRQNEQLLERLKVLGTRLQRARDYANDPESNPSLATTLVAHARTRYAEVVAQVRANRVESIAILRACGRIGVGVGRTN